VVTGSCACGRGVACGGGAFFGHPIIPRRKKRVKKTRENRRTAYARYLFTQPPYYLVMDRFTETLMITDFIFPFRFPETPSGERMLRDRKDKQRFYDEEIS
jgi:hypothetical protein